MTLARKISSYVPSKKKTETKSSSINKKLFPFKFLSFFASKRLVLLYKLNITHSYLQQWSVYCSDFRL